MYLHPHSVRLDLGPAAEAGDFASAKASRAATIPPIPYVACAYMYYGRDAREHSRGQTLIAPHQLGGVQR